MLLKLIKYLAGLSAKPWPIKASAYLLVFFIFFLPGILVSIAGFSTTRSALVNLELERRRQLAILGASQTNQKLLNLVILAQNYSQNQKIRDLVADKNSPVLQETLDIATSLWNQKEVDRIFITDASGTELAASPQLSGAVGKNFSDRQWYRDIMKTDQPVVTDAYQRAAEPTKKIIAVAVPITGKDQARSGILVLQISVDTIAKWAQDLTPYKADYSIYLVDSSGQVISDPSSYPPGSAPNQASFLPPDKVLQGKTGAELTESGQALAYSPVPRYGWGLVVQGPASSVYKSGDHSLQVLEIIFVVIFIFYFYLVFPLLKAIREHYTANPTIASQ